VSTTQQMVRLGNLQGTAYHSCNSTDTRFYGGQKEPGGSLQTNIEACYVFTKIRTSNCSVDRTFWQTLCSQPNRLIARESQSDELCGLGKTVVAQAISPW